jgi:GPH family glycoside/pentoside/hexuronide:cation symporter
VIYSVAATAILLFCFTTTREPISQVAASHPSMRDMLAALRVNRAFLLLVVATALGTTGYTMASKALVYYLKYWAGGSESAVTLGLVTMLGSAAVAMIPWMLISRRTSKRAVWLAGAGLNVLAYASILILAPRGGPALWSALVAIGIGNSAFILTFWSMLPDTVEYGEFKTGTRAEGAIFGLVAFTQKIALGLGTGLIGVLLDAVGYAANRPQSPETLRGIVGLFGGGPLLLFAASILAIWGYPLSGRMHRRMVQTIEWRRARAARRTLAG